MKKSNSKSLALNKKAISKLDRLTINGGRAGGNLETAPVGICSCNASCHSCIECQK